MRRWSAFALAATIIGCVNEVSVPSTEGLVTTGIEGPLAGGAGDRADRACNVVLRDLGRVSDGAGGYVTNGTSWSFVGRVDAAESALLDGTTVKALYRSGNGGWREAEAAAVESHGGVVRHELRLDEGLPGPGWSGTALSRARVEVIPFLARPDGGRVFDHNRLPGDFDVYVLDASNALSLRDDPFVCASSAPPSSEPPSSEPPSSEPPSSEPPSSEPPPAPPAPALRFPFGEAPSQSGPLVENGAFVVEYDLERLTSCRGTHNGHPAWDLRAFARFLPGGELQEASVRAFETHNGTPTSTASAIPARFEVPAGATGVELWFSNTGINCEGWDSDGGRNYGFYILSAPEWVGNVRAAITRASGAPCDGAVDLGTGFTFGTWARQRAVRAAVCLEVYEPGVTDRDNPDLWRDVAVELHTRFDPSEPFASRWLSVDGRVGNNARYAFDVLGFDPFRMYQCPAVPTSFSETGGNTYLTARMEFYFTVNGVEVRPAGADSVFVGTFEDYPTDPWRDENCPAD